MRSPRIEHYEEMHDVGTSGQSFVGLKSEINQYVETVARNAAANGYVQALRDVIRLFDEAGDTGAEARVRILAGDKGIYDDLEANR